MSFLIWFGSGHDSNIWFNDSALRVLVNRDSTKGDRFAGDGQSQLAIIVHR